MDQANTRPRLVLSLLLLLLLAAIVQWWQTGPHMHPSPPQSPPAAELKAYTYQQALMGTRFTITLYSRNAQQADLAAEQAFHYAAEVNSACSDYDTTSELMLMNASAANLPFAVSPMLLEVLQEALTIARLTDGAYDPTLGLHSYNWRMARKKGKLPDPRQISMAKEHSGWQQLELNIPEQTALKKSERLRLDLGGIAKGFAADGMLKILLKHKISRASITAGGEIRLGDPPPGQHGWKIELKTLDHQHQISPRYLTLANCAIATSGDLNQSIIIDGKRYSHICDPQTGLGLTHRISATVIGDSATLTDALATALCVQPELNLPGQPFMLIIENDQGELSSQTSASWQPRINH